jgi:hypothetical protein
MSKIPGLGLLSSIPEFSGERSGIPVREFVEKIENARLMAKWDDPMTISVLKLKLTGAAREFIASNQELLKKTKVEDFTEVLIKQFSRPEDLATLHHELARLTQRPVESMRAWGARIKELGARFLRLTSDSPLLKEMLQARFEQGARDPDMRRFLRWTKFTSFDEMIEAAEREDLKSHGVARSAILHVESRMGDTIGREPRVSGNSGPRQYFQKGNRDPRIFGRQSPPKQAGLPRNPRMGGNMEARSDHRTTSGRARVKVTCFGCGQVGHMKRECSRGNIGPCYLCQQLGHLARNCPQRFTVESGNGKGPSSRLQ